MHPLCLHGVFTSLAPTASAGSPVSAQELAGKGWIVKHCSIELGTSAFSCPHSGTGKGGDQRSGREIII